MSAESDVRLPKASKAKTSMELPVSLHEALLEYAELLNEGGENTTRTELLQAGALLMLRMNGHEAIETIHEYRLAKVSDVPVRTPNVIPFRKRGRPRSSVE